MTSKTSSSPGGLRTMLAEAVQAYEQTKAAYLRGRFLGEAEQARAGDLLAALAATEQAAQGLLTTAGLAHIAGAPLQLDETAAPARRADEAVAAALAAAQTAHVELRAALCRLAEVQLTGQKWDDARRTLKPLLADRSAPLGDYAHELLCESYYRPGQQALEAEQWETARDQFELTLKQQAGYSDADALLREAYLRPARQALEVRKWEAVRQHAEPWLKAYKNDKEAHDLLCESYYRPGLQALEAGQPEAALLQLLALMEREQGYRDAVDLLRRSYEGLPKKMHPKIPGLEFVKIPAGEFLYGENKQKLSLDEFWIARTPVTNAQYQVFVRATGYQAPAHWSNGAPPKSKEQHPVVKVSWEDAQKFCGWAGVSLPGERQWEKAGRWSDGRTYPWGEAGPDGRRCNFANQVGDTTAVGSYPEGASPYGVLDMAGNVWEWCEDLYRPGEQYRVLRGGSFGDSADLVRCASRDYFVRPVSFFDLIGFRVVAPGL